MNAEHDPDDEQRAELLARLAAGELDMDSAEVKEHMAKDPHLAAKLQDLLDLDRELVDLGRTAMSGQRVAAPRGNEPWPGADEAVRNLVARELPLPGPADRPAHRSTHRPTARRTWWWPALAAAAAVIGLLVWQQLREPRLDVPGPDYVLGNGDKIEMQPYGEVDRDDVTENGFTWTPPDLRPGTMLELVITHTDGKPVLGRDGRPFEPVRVDNTGRWRPPSDIDLPDAGTWSLEAVGSSSRSRGPWTASFTLHD